MDVKERIKNFLKEYEQLCKKYKIIIDGDYVDLWDIEEEKEIEEHIRELKENAEETYRIKLT